MTRRAVLRRVETPKARAGVEHDAGDARGVLWPGIRASCANYVAALASEIPQVVVVIGPDRIRMGPKSGRVCRAQRVQVGDCQTIAIPQLREAAARRMVGSSSRASAVLGSSMTNSAFDFSGDIDSAARISR
jgi:hypothetical protein